MRLSSLLTLLACLAAAPAEPMPLIGAIRPRAASQITSSSWSIGGETLDRDYAVYANYSKYLGPLGAKAIRVQAGWAKCEKKPGVYDWAWLDEVVDDALRQGVRPWLETSYGNPIYASGGGAGLGAKLPSSPEALAAWDNWVKTLAQRYGDRVNEWEIWNEPDGHVPADDYAALFIRTSRIIRAHQPKARIYALGLAGNIKFAEAFLLRVKEKGELGLVDAITTHGYPKNPDDTGSVDGMRALVARVAPGIQVRQGETGAPSTAGTFGALRDHPWTELTQAKWDLRRMLAHHAKGVPFNLFTLMELHYPGRVNTKGLLRSNPDKTVAGVKPAYRAAQHVFSIFDDTLQRVEKFECTRSSKEKMAVYAWKKAGGELVIAAWFNGAVPADANEMTSVEMEFPRARFREPVWVDLRTGEVRRIPAERWKQRGDGCRFTAVPVYDSPILIAEKSALPIEQP